MLIRFSKKSKPVEITTDEFDEMVKEGKLTPSALIKNRFIAKEKWVSIDNMERFHRKSPIEYPPGPYLIQSRKIKNRRKKQKDKFSILLANYASGKLIEQCFELIPVKNLCSHFKVPTASRLTVMPAFRPELVITLLFGLDSISIDIIRGPTSVWSTIPQPIEINSISGTIPKFIEQKEDGSYTEIKAIPFDLTNANKVSIELSYSKKIYPFNDISLFLEQAKEAVDCYTPAMDGVSFRHEVVSDRTNIDFKWGNPTGREHPTQCNLISFYSNIAAEAISMKEESKDSNDIKEVAWWQF